MVKFDHDAFSKQDHFFVKDDPARIYRGLKDLLVEEFDMDRIEEGKSEFSVSSPKDKIRMHAFKEKSPHTVIHYNLQFRVKSPKNIYKMEHGQDILKARVSTYAEVVSVYPGGEDIAWLPKGLREEPTSNWGSITGLEAEHKSRFQRSKLYEIIVGLWHNKFYSKEFHMYEEEAKETCLHIHDLMREKFGVEKSIGRTGAGHYTPPWQ
ncbi:hypothetical protein [Candidatus Nanohalobium constans]|uniref:Uncharacterized protein n=1 Tax=Candidatus Nanohalobium constans TaxID=2565781 RepID=A0A5Q0UG27_9ARCH|nr:hypothetical protein [Candidatus Nanohalobium constans]QGA79915.1 hypothetical protein LC1Nh_0006 [Candidatus Nanohalobium constans]